MSSSSEHDAVAASAPNSQNERASTDAAAPGPTEVAADLAAVTRDVVSIPALDIKKLQSLPAEQQDLFLLTFISDLSKFVLDLSADDCTAHQAHLKREIIQIVNLQKPAPSRVIRNNLGHCLVHIFSRGDRKLLFETINELIGIIAGSKPKNEGDTRNKFAAVSCLGDLFAAAGDSAVGLHPLACSTLLKFLKSASNHAGARAAVFVALGKIVHMIEGLMDEAIARDIWKQARNHSSGDKGVHVVTSACRCLSFLCQDTTYFRNSTDFDKLESAMFKVFDSASSQARHAAGSCFAEALVCGQADPESQPVITAKKPKQKPKRASTFPVVAGDDDDLPARSESPAPGGRRTQELAFSCQDMLKTLCGHYVKSSTSNRARLAIGICLSKLFRNLGEKTIENNYLTIIEVLSVDILGVGTIYNHRHRLLTARKAVDVLVQDVIGRQIFGESGQISAAKALVNTILKNYPQALAERPEPTKQTLLVTLNAISSLIQALGSAATVFAPACQDGLLQILQHPSYSVQVFASHCIKALVLACPQQLLPCLSVCMNSLSRELNLLKGQRNSSSRRCLGFAHGLAAAIRASPSIPLYGSLDIDSRVLNMATNLLKTSGQSELRISATQIQVAWVLIGGLMSLGPNFIKIHLSQLLLLWKNALPKPLAKDNTTSRSMLETSFLTHVRECALGSMLAFLQFNGRLLTVDVSKRMATMLQNTTAFLKALPAKKVTEDVSQRLTPALQLIDLDMMVQRRVLQCYIKLVNMTPAGGSEAILQSNLLTLAISMFADPENYVQHSFSTSIANAAATFESIWDVGDNVGFGINGLVSGFVVEKLPGQFGTPTDVEFVEDIPETRIDRGSLSPICGSLEHDAAMLYTATDNDSISSPDPAATEVVNQAIQLFAFAFPLAPPKIQESILEQMKTFGSAGALLRDPGRKAAINVNIATAVLGTLRVATRETRSSPGDITNLAVERLLQDIVRDFVLDPDQYVRHLGYSAVARLCNVYGNAFTNNEVKFLVDMIVSNREPGVRAGCAMALGSIQTKIGGMAAGYHLKTILGIIMSLCNDPHPEVHYWALRALASVSDAAGLSFASFVPSTLGMLAQLYMSETHHWEIASVASSNLEMELPTIPAISRCVDSLVDVLGPDLQDATKSRQLILTLVKQLESEDDIQVLRAVLGCLEHLSVYAPGHMHFSEYVTFLQKHMASSNSSIRDSALEGLHNIMKREPRDVLQSDNQHFERQLWLVLDTAIAHQGIQNMIWNWLQQTCLTETSEWVQRLQGVLKMTRAASVRGEEKPSHTGAKLPDLRDEEVAGFAAASGITQDGKDNPATSEVEPLRWQARTFAMSCIDELFSIVAKDFAANGESDAHTALQTKVADIVRIAFSASTSSVLELRIWGLKIIGAVLRMFSKTPDPDFEEAMLLEQYQAQISSALTPAFAADSSPELASEAVNVCASFIATGIVTDVDRMGRILKTLVNALEGFSKDSENAGIGDLKGLSSNAKVMVKMSVFAAWAELQVVSAEQSYLLEVLQPHVGTLTPLWLESLREFARLRFEPDISMTLGPPSLSGSLDSIYAALNRETLLRFYQDAWLKLVDAIASLIEQDSEFVFDALDGKEASEKVVNGNTKTSGINYRDEPVAFFFVLFGLAFEALATRTGQSDSLTTQKQTLAILQVLKRILHPSVCGHAIYRSDVFAETMDLFDRLVLTDGLDVQGSIVEIARMLCVAHPSARRNSDEETDLSEDIEQLFELTRIIILVLSGLLPGLTDGIPSTRHAATGEAILLVRSSLHALVDAAEVFPDIIKTDLHACIFHIFATILSTTSCQELIVPQALPILKRFVATVTRSRSTASSKPSAADVQMQSCLRRFLSVYLQGQKRESPESLTSVKNSILAITILFTGGENQLPATEPLVTRFLEELLDCLKDRMTARIAANCVRSLLVQSLSTVANESIARFLFSRLLSFVTNCDHEDPENARSMVAHTLVQYASALQKSRLSAAISLILPALMSRAASEGQDVYTETSQRLVDLAAADQAGFRGVVSKMNSSQRTLLEEILRSGQSSTNKLADASDSGPEQPTIALKMDFGG